jgi:transposase
MEQRAVIRYYTLKGTDPARIHAKLLSIYNEGALKRSAVYKWHKRFVESRTDLGDDPRSGRPSHDEFAEGMGP